MALLENIAANNGWAMAVTGAIIVMVGLAVLATIISQLHRIIAFFEPRQGKSSPSMAASQKPAISTEVELLGDPAMAVSVYRPLSADLGQKFELSKLYALIKLENDAHPHLTIRSLRDAGYIVKADDDLFCWKVE